MHTMCLLYILNSSPLPSQNRIWGLLAGTRNERETPPSRSVSFGDSQSGAQVSTSIIVHQMAKKMFMSFYLKTHYFLRCLFPNWAKELDYKCKMKSQQDLTVNTEPSCPQTFSVASSRYHLWKGRSNNKDLIFSLLYFMHSILLLCR